MGRRFPPWLRKKVPSNYYSVKTKGILKRHGLNTVCQSAKCPNQLECFAQDTATFMLLGDICTRNCRFCAVEGGEIKPPDSGEPERIASAAEELGLEYVVLTSVTRDDLDDGGAGHFARTIRAIKDHISGVRVEVLTPDFQGQKEAINTVVAARPDVYNHNLETVPRLYPAVRPEADYQQSLQLLELVGELDQEIYTKSGLMVGLGEDQNEILAVMRDLRAVGCDLLTIGQYLQPSSQHLEVTEYIEPHIFEEYRRQGEEMGFMHVFSGPFVRSSFRAAETLGS